MKVIHRDKTWELSGRTTVRDVIKKVGLKPGAVLPIMNGKLVTDDVLAGDEDTVRLISVVSGG